MVDEERESLTVKKKLLAGIVAYWWVGPPTPGRAPEAFGKALGLVLLGVQSRRRRPFGLDQARFPRGSTSHTHPSPPSRLLPTFPEAPSGGSRKHLALAWFGVAWHSLRGVCIKRGR